MKMFLQLLLISCLGFSHLAFSEQSAADAVTAMQKQWAINNYQLTGKAQQQGFVQLLDKSDHWVAEFPESAAVLIWRGIIKSTYAGVKGGLGALGYAKAAKADLEQAIKLDGNALNGSAYTSLGTLYSEVPGWPIGFGDDKKAQQLLEKALTINPEGIDSNYFYAKFLASEKHYVKAKEYLQLAAKATPRPGRELADQGRQQEIAAVLVDVEKHLN